MKKSDKSKRYSDRPVPGASHRPRLQPYGLKLVVDEDDRVRCDLLHTGEEIVFTILRARFGRAKVLISAPQTVRISREQVEAHAAAGPIAREQGQPAA